MNDRPIHRIVNLVAPERRVPGGTDPEHVSRMLFDDPASLSDLPAAFAVVARRGDEVRLARSLDRPLRYFLAKEGVGPYLVVAERIDEILERLRIEGHEWQFHPTYTRMVPAHHVTEIRLVGCPDPSPRHHRFFSPPKDVLPGDPAAIGTRYVAALLAEVRAWLDRLPEREPIGVLFSGGIDSGAVLLAAYRALLDSGSGAARLKAFTLAVDGGGSDVEQAREFLRAVDLAYLGEELVVAGDTIDPLRAVEVIEDYKPLDVQCAAVNLAALEAIRGRYPDWKYLLDGDGGDENLKDYPIEENRELTIRSVVTNPLLYHEGWGVDALKHSETYSGGLSRGYVRTCAPQRRFGFEGFSPFTRPAVVAVAEGIPFDDLCRGDVEALYDLKGAVVAAGVREVLGVDMPAFPKRRFQEGALPSPSFARHFQVPAETYRSHHLAHFDAASLEA
ncbi:MAG: asparagine synthase-related protein [Thermoanaerobaculia bacterium]|nr:asparagine synthase-related protein [Thermoanaerobaculia bacterium]